MINITNLSNEIWAIADLLRGDFKKSDFGKIILPFTILRRVDCILDLEKDDFLKKFEEKKKTFAGTLSDPVIRRLAGRSFYNTSKYTLQTILNDAEHLKANLIKYINSFSDNIRDIMGHFKIEDKIQELDKANLLFKVVQQFSEFDLHADKVDGMSMGYAFEELIRKFAEESNETAGEHFTPREVIELIVDLLFSGDNAHKMLTGEGKVFTVYDPACGTGGMLSAAEKQLSEMNTSTKTVLFGQEVNPESSAICASDMIVKGHDIQNIALGDTLRDDKFNNEKFDFMLCNPPFGVQWKKQEKEVKQEAEDLGYEGRFGAGLPRISDGSFLFLQHMISKMKPVDDKDPQKNGSRIGIVFNGSPLFSGGAGSGESNIRKWIIENDYLESIVALPKDLFYNTGITTYIWILTNNKDKKRKGKIQLLNAIDIFEKMRKSLGSKRHYMTDTQIADIAKAYGEFKETDICKIFDNEEFGFERITVDRPLMKDGKVVKDKKGDPKPDTKLRDNENVPLKEDIQTYFEREVLPHVSDAWIDESKTVRGYEIPFTRHFYNYQPPRPLNEIETDLQKVQKEILDLMGEV